MKAICYGIGAILLAAGTILSFCYAVAPWSPIFLMYGATLLIVLVVERGRYMPNLSRRGGSFQPTGERFIDPVSKQLTEVYYNSGTGERKYMVVSDLDQKSV